MGMPPPPPGLTRRQCTAWALAWPALAATAPGAPAATTVPVLTPRPLRFPRDHGAHPEWRTEWWYLTGWGNDSNGRLYGFQLTFFRTRVDEAQGLRSRLAARQLLMAHAAITDVGGQRHVHTQRLGRWNGEAPQGAPQPGTHHAALDDTDLALAGWRLRRAPDGSYHGSVADETLAITLHARPSQPLLLQGDDGFSRKGPGLSQASFYVTEPQLAVQAELRLGRQSVRVQGRAWLDHEWSEALMAPDAVGWDWVCMNGEDGSALTAFQLRRAVGGTLWAGGSWRAPGQAARVFGPQELRWVPERHWRSPRTGAAYPVAWRLHTPAGEYRVSALLDDQELSAAPRSGPVYWEGLSDWQDSRGQRLGRGYLEMTGYAGRLVL